MVETWFRLTVWSVACNIRLACPLGDCCCCWMKYLQPLFSLHVQLSVRSKFNVLPCLAFSKCHSQPVPVEGELLSFTPSLDSSLELDQMTRTKQLCPVTTDGFADNRLDWVCSVSVLYATTIAQQCLHWSASWNQSWRSHIEDGEVVGKLQREAHKLCHSMNCPWRPVQAAPAFRCNRAWVCTPVHA